MMTTIYIPTHQYHWLRQKVSKDWLTAMQTIYANVSAYLVDHAMPNYAESWRDLNMPPRHHTLKLPQEIVDYFTQLGQGDFKLGFFIAIEVHRYAVDREGAITGWAIWKAFHNQGEAAHE